MNDGITRSGSFGPAAELAAAHTEIERLKAWSNEQIAKLQADFHNACDVGRRHEQRWLAAEREGKAAEARVEELQAEVTRWREAWAKAQARLDTTTHEWKEDPDPRYLFEGEPEHCSLCGEAGHTHDDHWLFQHEPVQALVVKLKKLEEPNHDDPLWLRNEVRRLRGVLRKWHAEMEHLKDELRRREPGPPEPPTRTDETLPPPPGDDEWKELDPKR